RERQILFKIPDVSELVVDLKIDEANVFRVKPGQPARVSIKGTPQETLSGIVDFVGRRRLPARAGDGVYAIRIKLDQRPKHAKVGTAAQVEIVDGSSKN